jgi:ribosome-binding factor A
MPRHRTPAREAGPTQRQLRAGEVLRHAISEILTRGDVRDPDLEGVSVTVTQVKPSADMRHAVIFCEPLGGRNAHRVIDALNRHRGFVRGRLGPAIRFKFTPELRFVEDISFAEAEKIESLLRSARVQRDLKIAREGDDNNGA